MEHAIYAPGKHLAALQNLIEVHVRGVVNHLPPSEELAPANRAALLDFMCPIIDEYVARARHELYKEHRAHADACAQANYLALGQDILLELIGHLLEYTQPIQLYRTLSHRTLTDDICRDIYQSLESLLNYTVVKLADGQIDPGLPLPPAACMLYQQMLGSELIALRERLVELHVSAGLIDIVLLPFEELWREDYVTFYTAVYLRALKQKLQALAGTQRSPGDGDMLDLLVVHNFNEPAFVAYYHQVIEGELETSTSPEARLRRLHDYKNRLARLSYGTGLAWHPRPHQPSVRQQLTEWLDMVIAGPVIPIPSTISPPFTSDHEEYEIPDGLQAAHALMLHLHPAVFGAIVNAAHERGHIYLGEKDKQRAGLLARIRSSIANLAAETIRRAFNEVDACRKAVAYLQDLIDYLKIKIEKLEKKSSF